MKDLLLLLLALLCALSAAAQEPLCLAKGEVPGSIDFRPEAVNRYLNLDRYRVVIFGEMHNGTFNPEIEYHLITDLNRQYGFRHVFLEVSVSTAWHLNQYLRTGDTADLHIPFEHWRVFWKRLYDYNVERPDSLKLVFHGVDFERTGVFATLRELAPAGSAIPPSLQPMMDTAAAHISDAPLRMYDIIDGKMIIYDNAAFTRTLRYIQGELKAHAADAAQYFGSNYPMVRDIANNEGEVVVAPKPRNRTMFRTMRRIVADEHIGKFIGIFGAQHTTYTVPSSIANAVSSLPGFRQEEVLNIMEIVLHLLRQGDGQMVQLEHAEKLEALNGNCKASFLPAGAVPGYGRKADVVLIGDANK